MAYDYYADRPAAHQGLEHTATLIERARAEQPNCLLLDNGDFLQGNPLGDYIAQSGADLATRPHPAIRAMNRLGYDAATLGNHEFNYGLEILDSALRGAAFPVVSANVVWRLGRNPLEDDTYLPPFALIDRDILAEDGQRHPLRIAVIGLAPPQFVQWDRHLLRDALLARDIVEAAAARVPQMRAAGADVVVALSHSGIGGPDGAEGREHVTGALAQVPGIDAIIAGHSHLLFPSAGFAGLPGADLATGTLFGVPVAMPGFYGSHLGVIDLRLVRRDGRWRVSGARAEVRAVGPDTPASPAVRQAIGSDHAATLAYARQPVGHSTAPLHSFLTPVAPSAALRIVAEAQAAHVARQLAGSPEARLPILSAVSPFKAGGRGGPDNYTHVPPGDLALRHAADLYIYPNSIAALRLTGAELTDWLDHAAGLFLQVAPGAQDAPLIDPDFPSYNHDVIFGLDYAIDLSVPPRFDRQGALRDAGKRRIAGLRFRDQPLDPEAEFILVTNSYRATGCGGYGPAPADRQLDLGHAAVRDVLLRHLSAPAATVLAPAPRHARFLPMPGTSVIFDTAPAASRYLEEIAAFRPEPLGPTPEGFARFRLHL